MEDLDDIKRWAKGEFHHSENDVQDIAVALSKVVVFQQEQIELLKQIVQANTRSIEILAGCK